MLSFPHASVLLGLKEAEQIYRYIDEESFLATAAGHTVDAWSGVKSKDS